MKKMRILVLSFEAWNDEIHGNNNMTNWFRDFDAEFAHIYLDINYPKNSVCKKYFQFNDFMVLDNILHKTEIGREFELEEETHVCEKEDFEKKESSILNKVYKFLAVHSGESVRAIREIMWSMAELENDKLKKFVLDFNPDVIFSPRLAVNALLRLERYLSQITNKKVIAFTGDDEYSLQQFRISPIYWLSRIILRKNIKKTVPCYNMYYTLSEEQSKIFHEEFGVESKVLTKGTINVKEPIIKTKFSAIKLVYGGKLYCKRWRSLKKLADAIKKINQAERKRIFELEIYSPEKRQDFYKKVFNDDTYTFFKGATTPQELQRIYENADILVHVESFKLKERYKTKFSFSTKIIDYIASGKAIMAICWKGNSGYKYLKKENAALCIEKMCDIEKTLKMLMDKPEIINDVANNVYNLAKHKHSIKQIQKELYTDFIRLYDL